MPDSDFSRAVLQWFMQHGRTHLPWQQNLTPYRVWLSEIMLQQTQVSTVIPYFNTFTEKFPSVEDLASATLDEVLHLWTGLGYYARARNLHRCAQTVVHKYGGEFPQDVTTLSELPGIGRSTAGAICSIVWNQPAAILDGNVKRVLARHFAIDGWPGQTAVANQLWDIAETLTPQQQPGAYSQAMMDLGATLCTRSKPNCLACPVTTTCLAFAAGNPTDYPGKKPQKVLPIKQVQMLMLQNADGEFLLQQRPTQGIWGGLWSFPELASDASVTNYCLDHWGDCSITATWDTYRHTFSHYHLDITPVWLRLNKSPAHIMEAGQHIWYNSAQPATVGLAAPVKRLLAQLQQSTYALD